MRGGNIRSISAFALCCRWSVCDIMLMLRVREQTERGVTGSGKRYVQVSQADTAGAAAAHWLFDIVFTSKLNGCPLSPQILFNSIQIQT